MAVNYVTLGAFVRDDSQNMGQFLITEMFGNGGGRIRLSV